MKNVSYADKVYSSLQPIGEHVLLKKLQNDDLRKVNGVYVPHSTQHENMRMGCGQVLDAPEKILEENGLKRGDYVLYDYWSVHGDHADTVITAAENLIVVLTEEEAQRFVKGDN